MPTRSLYASIAAPICKLIAKLSSSLQLSLLLVVAVFITAAAVVVVVCAAATVSPSPLISAGGSPESGSRRCDLGDGDGGTLKQQLEQQCSINRT